MMVELNPFIWDRPIDDPAKIVGMDTFAHQVALMLKGQTNVALFGPRDSGKTTFTAKLADELQKVHGDDAPGFSVVQVNLQRAFSIPAFIACVRDALLEHPNRTLRREARRRLESVEKEIGFDFKVLRGSMKRSIITPEQTAEALHAHLRVISHLDENVVVIFDEFQRLRDCPGEPLSIIRSALMSRGSNHVSLMITGSIRNALKMMLEDTNSPFFGEAHHIELPVILKTDFEDYLRMNFEATGRKIEDETLRYLLNITNGHPRRTQQIAWQAWQDSESGQEISMDDIASALKSILSISEVTEFASIYQLLMDGTLGSVNELRALVMLADRGVEGISGELISSLYGFSSRSAPNDALKRLETRGFCIKKNGQWQIIDPIFAEWLRQQSPLAEH